METAAADGSVPTDKNLQVLFRELQERTRLLYREALTAVPEGKSLSTAHIPRPRRSRKIDADLTRVLSDVAGRI